jgi:hypothetical protein
MISLYASSLLAASEFFSFIAASYCKNRKSLAVSLKKHKKCQKNPTIPIA